MDQAITRAAGATPSTTPPAAAASRLVGEFQGFVDGIEPSVHWLDRKNMPQVGDRLFAIPAHAAVPRSWSILLTSANHGTVGPLGSTFPHAGEHHERVVVVEVPAAAGAPSDEVNLVLRAERPAEVAAAPLNSITATHRHDEGAIARCSYCGRYSLDPEALSDRQPTCDCGKQHGWSGSFKTPGPDSRWSGNAPAAAPVAAQAGQVAVPEGFVLMPKRLTAENGAKSLLLGEFSESTRVTCHECDGSGEDSEYDSGCVECGGEGTIEQKVAVEWDTIKRIYDMAVQHLAAAPSAPAEAQQAPATDALDAARYRWLCEHGHERMPEAVLQVVDAAHYEGEQIPKDLIDQVIDKERGAQAAGERQEGGAA